MSGKNMTREEAINVIKGWVLADKDREALETILPELKRDDKERIKENCIHFLELQKSHHASTVEIDECIDWLKDLVPPKWLYRLEYKDGTCGLWYNGDGKWCFEEGIGSLVGCKTKDLPMDHDERYKQDGRDWFSSCSNKEDLLHWYSLNDAEELIKKGFVFTRYLATEYHEYENETVFIKDSSLEREEIDIFELFGETKPMFKEGDWIKNLEAILKYIKDKDLQEWLKDQLRMNETEVWRWSEEDKENYKEILTHLECQGNSATLDVNRKKWRKLESWFKRRVPVLSLVEEDKKIIEEIISDLRKSRINEEPYL